MESKVTTTLWLEVSKKDKRVGRRREISISRIYDSELVSITIPAGPTTGRTITIEGDVRTIVAALQRRVVSA